MRERKRGESADFANSLANLMISVVNEFVSPLRHYHSKGSSVNHLAIVFGPASWDVTRTTFKIEIVQPRAFEFQLRHQSFCNPPLKPGH